jgi:type I restriction enzyme M protein
LGKTNPLNEKDLAEFIELQKTKADSKNSWSVDISSINQETLDLSVNNPDRGGEVSLREPKEIFEEMKGLDKKSEQILSKIKKYL